MSESPVIYWNQVPNSVQLEVFISWLTDLLGSVVDPAFVSQDLSTKVFSFFYAGAAPIESVIAELDKRFPEGRVSLGTDGLIKIALPSPEQVEHVKTAYGDILRQINTMASIIVDAGQEKSGGGYSRQAVRIAYWHDSAMNRRSRLFAFAADTLEFLADCKPSFETIKKYGYAGDYAIRAAIIRHVIANGGKWHYHPRYNDFMKRYFGPKSIYGTAKDGVLTLNRDTVSYGRLFTEYVRAVPFALEGNDLRAIAPIPGAHNDGYHPQTYITAAELYDMDAITAADLLNAEGFNVLTENDLRVFDVFYVAGSLSDPGGRIIGLLVGDYMPTSITFVAADSRLCIDYGDHYRTHRWSCHYRPSDHTFSLEADSAIPPYHPGVKIKAYPQLQGIIHAESAWSVYRGLARVEVGNINLRDLKQFKPFQDQINYAREVMEHLPHLIEKFH